MSTERPVVMMTSALLRMRTRMKLLLLLLLRWMAVASTVERQSVGAPVGCQRRRLLVPLL